MEKRVSLLVNVYEIPLIEYLKPFIVSVHTLARDPCKMICSDDKDLDDARRKMEVILRGQTGKTILDRFLSYGLSESRASGYEDAMVKGINIRLPLPPDPRLMMISIANKARDVYFVYTLLLSIRNLLKVLRRGGKAAELYLLNRPKRMRRRIEERAPEHIKEGLLKAFDKHLGRILRDLDPSVVQRREEIEERIRKGATLFISEISRYCIVAVKDLLNYFSYAFVHAIDDDTFFVYSFGSLYVISFGKSLEDSLGIKHTMRIDISLKIDAEYEEEVRLALKYILLAFSLIDGASDAGVLSSYLVTRVIETLDPFMADEFATYISGILANVSGTVEGVRIERVRDLEGITIYPNVRLIKIGGYVYQGILVLKRIGAYEIIELLNVIDAVREQILLISNSVSSSLHTLLSVHSEVQEIVKEAKEEYRESKPLIFLSALSAIVLAADGLLSLYKDFFFYYGLHRLGVLLAGARLGYFAMSAFYDTYIRVSFEPTYGLSEDSVISYERRGRYAERIYKKEIKSSNEKLYGVFGVIVLALMAVVITLNAKSPVYRPNMAIYILTVMLSGAVGFMLIGKASVRYTMEILYPEGKIQVRRREGIRGPKMKVLRILLYFAVAYLIAYSTLFIYVVGARGRGNFSLMIKEDVRPESGFRLKISSHHTYGCP